MANEGWREKRSPKCLALPISFLVGLLTGYGLFADCSFIWKPAGIVYNESDYVLREITKHKQGSGDGILNGSRTTTYSPGVKIGALKTLLPGLVENVVHYLWCEEKIFEFQHYLSLRSVMRAINPDRVVFHYGHYPECDKQFYNTWFEDAKNEFPVIELDDVGSNSTACASPSSQRDYLSQTIRQRGGIYVHYDTIFFRFPLSLRQNRITDGLANQVEGFLVMQKGARYDDGASAGVERIECPTAEQYSSALNNSKWICAVKNGPYYPRDAWHRQDSFSKMVNKLLYGTEQTPEAKPSNDTLIPNIGHLIWIGGGEMSFLFYLNCLSQIHILNVDALYVHGDTEPRGAYWEEIKANPIVVFIRIVKPDLVFGKRIRIINHMADVYRVMIMARYGGIYTDADAVWIKPVPRSVRQYDAVASYDWPQMYDVYPDYIQCGVMLSKPDAGYWRLVMQSFRDFRDDFYGYNGLLKPYKMLERHPETLFVYDKLQVMCWELRCHPTWYPDFREKSADHRRYPDFDWREANTFHWTYPTPKELENEDALRNSSTMFAEIGKHILKASGKHL